MWDILIYATRQNPTINIYTKCCWSTAQILDEIHFQRRTQTDTTDDELSAESNDRLQEEADSDDEQQEGFSIALPLPGCEKVLGMEQAGCASGTRLVPGVCAVCLIEYTTGEEITWSSNYKCFHAFHATCMTEYIERKREIAPCPMCRQDFLAKNLTSRSMKDESASDTSDDVSISSRRSSMVWTRGESQSPNIAVWAFAQFSKC